MSARGQPPAKDRNEITIILLRSWRRMSRAAHEALTKRAVQNYHPIQMKESTILVSSLLISSGNFKPDRHFKRLTTSTIMSIVYDYPTIMSEQDPSVERMEKYIDRLSRAAAMGAYLVDIFPWMKYIPERSWRSLLLVVSLLILTD